MSSLKSKTINGLIWSFVERFGYLFLQFITNLILARILTPSEFGLIGMMMVFVALSLTFIDGGFGAALIQKEKPNNNDYSTVFYINIIIAITLYLLLFVFSNKIASFFSQSQLSLLLKVLGSILLIDSIGIVQNNILIKNISFKKIAIIKIISASISCSTAILFAYNGLGVWSLVVLYVLNSSMRSLLLWFNTSWRPSLIFSKSSFKDLFGFGSKLLTARFISEFYIHMQSLVIGRVFSSADLGFYTQAKQLQQVPVQSLSTVINSVTFPVFSSLQNDKIKLKEGMKKSMKSAVFINFPIMVFLTVIAKSLIIVLYTEKWLPSVPYFQILCIGFGLLLIVHSINLSAIKSVGKSDWILYLEIIKKLLGVIFIIVGIKIYGIMGVLYALAINSLLEFFLNGHFTGKAINYGIISQLKDILPALLIALITGLITYLTIIHYMTISGEINIIILCLGVYSLLYLTLSYMFKIDSMNYYSDIISEMKVKKNI